MGLQLIDNLQKVHACGFVHNDIKPENILLASDDFGSLKSSEIKLIDFGLSTSFLTEEKKHIEKEPWSQFRGNYLYSSHNAFKG